jgi:hypothetical protein
LLLWIVHLTVHLSQSNDSKIKIQKQTSYGLPTLFSSVSYIKREMRETEKRKKKQRRQIEKIKIEIRPSQLQMTITFDRKLRLRCATRLQKAYDWGVLLSLPSFSGPKNSILILINTFKIYLKFLVQFYFYFFLEILYVCILLSN